MSYWTANLKALSRRRDGVRFANLIAPLGAAPESGLRSRDGRALPGFDVQERPRALVSQYDEVREAQRWASEAAGTVAVFGGAGVQAAKALSSRGVGLMFWVEPRLEVWRSLLTWEDWSEWLTRETWVPVWDLSDWGQSLRLHYHPLWNGAFQTLEWRSAVQGFEHLWSGFLHTAQNALDSWASDASTQARFGERWYRNTLVNLKHLRAAQVEACVGARVVIAGAGPGLDDALEDAENQRWIENRTETGDRLFSTDTALPALTVRGIVPDLVLCLDGQLASYHHFVPAKPPVPLVADLASLPLMNRVGMPVVRFLSGHPLGAVIRRSYPELPQLDSSLGNVSGIALTTALALGAQTVDAWGVDFSYRSGQAYAHGTYVYETAGRSSTRLQPLETRLTTFYGSGALEQSRDDRGRLIHTTGLLRDYQARWRRFPRRSDPIVLAHGGSDRWEEFSASWKDRLRRLPIPEPGVAMNWFVRGLDDGTREDWWALWPLALALHRQGVAAADLPAAAIERALFYLSD